MTEQVWWAAGARLPIVMCVANRAMAAPWNVLNDQQDSMSVRDAGWVQLYCRDNQEILDTTVQAYRIAEQLHVPVMVCYDGFLLSHTVMPVEVADRRDSRRVPAAVHRSAHRRRPGRPAQHRSGHARRPACRRRRRRYGHGYMEIRALHQQALLEALDVIPAVDAELGARYRPRLGRSDLGVPARRRRGRARRGRARSARSSTVAAERAARRRA